MPVLDNWGDLDLCPSAGGAVYVFKAPGTRSAFYKEHNLTVLI